MNNRARRPRGGKKSSLKRCSRGRCACWRSRPVLIAAGALARRSAARLRARPAVADARRLCARRRRRCRVCRLTHAQAVDRLLVRTLSTASQPAPAWIDERIIPPRELRAMSDEARGERQKQFEWASTCAAGGCRRWWLRPPAHRADDAVLAQPLRVGATEGALHAADVPAERRCCAARARQLRRSCCTRWRGIRRC